jgi:hypothetical protein
MRFREIFQKPIIIIQGMRCTPFLIGDVIYPIRTYLQKNCEINNLTNVDKIRYDSNMN